MGVQYTQGDYKDIKKRIQGYKDKHKEYARGKEEIWMLNESDYKGKFYKRFNREIQSLVDIDKRYEYLIRTSANHTFTFVRALHSMMVSNPPSVTVYPSTNEEKDKDASIAADHIGQFERRRGKVDDYSSHWLFDMLIYGSGIVKTYWDPRDGVPITTGNVINQDRKKVKEYIFEGNVKHKNINIRDFYFDPTVTNFLEARWALEKQAIPVEIAQKLYPKFKDKLQEVEDLQVYNSDRAKLEKAKGQTVVYEYWEVKDWMNDNKGRYTVVTEDGTIIKDESHPYEHGRLPYQFLTDIDLPQNAWGQSVIEMFRDPQKALNRLLSQILENINVHGVIRVAVPEQASIQEKSITDRPIDIIKYNGQAGTPPMQLQPASLPSHMFKMYDMLVNAMEHIAGLRGYSRGEMPKVVSGFAAQLMIEQDQKVHIQLHNKYKRGVEGWYRQILSLCNQFWTEERNITILGSEEEYEYFRYSQSNLEGQYDVATQYGTSLPADPASRRQAIMELYKEGLIEDKATVLRLLELGNITGAFDITKDARKRQKEEIEIIKKARQGFGIREFEDHEAHLEELYAYAQRKEFENLDEETKRLIEAHILEHENKVKGQAAPQGAPGELPTQGFPEPGTAPLPEGGEDPSLPPSFEGGADNI